MRISLIIALSFFPSFSYAETVTTVSVLDAVKVFPRGALYDRKVALNLPAGVHQIFVSGLPQSLNVATLQARAEGITIRAMEFRTERQVLMAPVKTDQQVAAEQVLDGAKQNVARLVNERAQVAAQIASAELRIQYLKSTADGKLAGSGAQSNQTAEQLAGVVQALGTAIYTAVVELTGAKNTHAQSDRGLAEARDDVERARAALEVVTPLYRETGTAVIDLVASNAFNGNLTLMYSNNDAAWGPSYEVTVDQTGAKASINMVRLAAVYQHSEEDWSDISVTLSTSNLDRSTEVYLPRSDIKFIYEPEKLQRLSKQSFDQSEIAMGSLAEPVMEVPASPRVESSEGYIPRRLRRIMEG